MISRHSKVALERILPALFSPLRRPPARTFRFAPPPCPLSFHSLTLRCAYPFSKKQEQKPKRKDYIKTKPKTEADYIEGSEQFKRNVIQVKNLQTASQANFQSERVRAVIQENRKALEESFKEEQEMEREGGEKAAKKGGLFDQSKPDSLQRKYFLLNPLKHLHSLFLACFSVNLLSLGYYEFVESYHSLGWTLEMLTQPTAMTAVGLLLGYNFAFWIIRQSFSLHTPTSQLSSANISLISTKAGSIAELSFLVVQMGLLSYSLLFPLPVPLYKVFVLLATANFASMALNLYKVSVGGRTAFRNCLKAYVSLISSASLIILLFGVYEVQLRASESPEQVLDSESFKRKIGEMREGSTAFKNALKVQNEKIKENEKINFFDDQQ